MTLSLKKIIVPGYSTKFLFFILSALLWLLIFFSESAYYDTNFASNELFAYNFTLVNVYNILLTALNGLFLYLFIKNFAVIRNKTFIPVFVYVLLITLWPDTHKTYYPNLILTILLFSLNQFYKSYKNKNDSKRIFAGSLFLGLSSFINPYTLLLIPVFLISLSILKSLSLRTFFASLIGVSVPWILYISYLYYSMSNSIYPKINFEGIQFQFYNPADNPTVLIYKIVNFVFLLIGLNGMYSGSNKDSLQTRNFLNVITTLLIFSLLFNSYIVNLQSLFFPFIAFLSSIIIAHPVSLKNSKFYHIYFIIILFTNIIFAFYKIYFQ